MRAYFERLSSKCRSRNFFENSVPREVEWLERWNTKKESCELENIVNDIFLEISFFARLIGYFDRAFSHIFPPFRFLPFRRYDIYRLVIISQNC